MNTLRKPIRKNATKMIATFLANATRITRTVQTSQQDDSFDSHKEAATAQDVLAFIKAEYHNGVNLEAIYNADGQAIAFYVRGKYYFVDSFVVRLDSAEQYERIEAKAKALGLEMKANDEITIFNPITRRFLGVQSANLDVIDAALTKFEAENAPQPTQEEMLEGAEFLVKRLEDDAMDIFKNLGDIQSTNELNIRFAPIQSQLLKLGFTHKNAVTLVRQLINRCGAIAGLPPLFTKLSID